MSPSKAKVNIEWLSDCGGCHVAIVDLHEKILDVLGSIEIQHCPVLTDIKDYPHATIGLISGAIRTAHDRHAAEQMRQSCEVVIAWGTCAVYGGIPGAALAHSRSEILDAVYLNNPTTRTKVVPDTCVDGLEKLVTPLDEVIKVDYYLPGCPPHAAYIFKALRSLLEPRERMSEQQTVCARCTRNMERTSVDRIRSNHEGIPDRETCLLSQGYVCLGSVTLDRCLAPCPSNGTTCTGCAGPSLNVLTEPNRDLRSEIAERMSALTRIPRQAVAKEIERSSKSHYSYAMASRMIGGKPTMLLKKWIAEIEEEA